MTLAGTPLAPDRRLQARAAPPDQCRATSDRPRLALIILSLPFSSSLSSQVGDECAQHRAMLETSYPVENGIVKDWTGMQHVWDYTFFEVRTRSS